MTTFISVIICMVGIILSLLTFIYLVIKYKTIVEFPLSAFPEDFNRKEYLDGLKIRRYVLFMFVILNNANCFMKDGMLQFITPLITVGIVAKAILYINGYEESFNSKKNTVEQRSEWMDKDKEEFEKQKKAFAEEERQRLKNNERENKEN